MRFDIQLIYPSQQRVKVKVTPVAAAGGNSSFDSVRIESGQEPHFPCACFMVPAGRGEALAEALRKAIAP